MNKMIRQFASDASIITENGVHRYATSSEFEQRFAEMIVRECYNHLMTSDDRYRRDYFAKKLLEHFDLKDDV